MSANLHLERKFTLQAKMEHTYADGGAKAGVSGSFYIPAFIEAKPELNMEKIENPIYYNSLGRSTLYTGKAFWKTTLKYFLKGTPSDILKYLPEWTPLMQAANLPYDTGSAVAVFCPADTNPRPMPTSSATLVMNLDGTQYVISGARADSTKITFEAGAPAIIEQSFTGLYTEPESVTLPSPTFRDAGIVPPIAQSIGLTVLGVQYDITKITYELKNKLTQIDSLNASHRGIQSFEFSGREYGGSLQMKVTDANDVLMWSQLTASTEVELAMAGMGDTGGNTIILHSDKMQIEEVRPTVVNGVNYYDITFRINLDSANNYDELLFEIT